MPKGMLAPKAPGIFTAKLSGSGYGGKLWYSWAATRGTVSGEFGSPVMQLLTTKKDGGVNVTVFVRVEGLTPGCPNMASEIVSVAQIPEVDPPDGFGVLKANDVKARIDNFYVALKANEPYTGLIDMYFGPKESRAQRLARINQILWAIRFRKYDINKISFAFTESPYSPTTNLSMIPPGADVLEERPGVVFVKGRDVMRDPKKALPKRQCPCK